MVSPHSALRPKVIDVVGATVTRWPPWSTTSSGSVTPVEPSSQQRNVVAPPLVQAGAGRRGLTFDLDHDVLVVVRPGEHAGAVVRQEAELVADRLVALLPRVLRAGRREVVRA